MPEILINYADEKIIGVFVCVEGDRTQDVQLPKYSRATFLYEQYA